MSLSPGRTDQSPGGRPAEPIEAARFSIGEWASQTWIWIPLFPWSPYEVAYPDWTKAACAPLTLYPSAR
jgi:hypothetical protein